MTENPEPLMPENDEEVREDPHGGFFTGIFKTLVSIFVLAILKSPFLFFVWNASMPFLTKGQLAPMEFWQAIIIVVALDIFNFFSAKNLFSEPHIITVFPAAFPSEKEEESE